MISSFWRFELLYLRIFDNFEDFMLKNFQVWSVWSLWNPWSFRLASKIAGKIAPPFLTGVYRKQCPYCQAQPSSIQLQFSWLGWDSFNFNFYQPTHPQGKYRAQLSPAQSNSNSVGWANQKQNKLETSLSWAWHSSVPACFFLFS